MFHFLESSTSCGRVLFSGLDPERLILSGTRQARKMLVRVSSDATLPLIPGKCTQNTEHFGIKYNVSYFHNKRPCSRL